jgi:hypothetical protein
MISDACVVVVVFPQTYENICMAGGVKTIHDNEENYQKEKTMFLFMNDRFTQV